MDKKIYLGSLYDYYESLLTDKQKLYFTAYYFQDFSLSEIAENNQVSRNAIYHQLKIVEDKLMEYETALHLCEKGKKIEDLLQEIKDEKLREKIQALI